MTAAEEEQLRKHRLLFEKPKGGTLLAGADATRDWPSGRGIFHNDEKTFVVWVNEADHMQIISMENSGDIPKVFTRWVKCAQIVEESIKRSGYEFMYNNHLGFLSTCPSSVGTALRASVFLNLEKLGQNSCKLENICQSLGLQSQRLSGEYGTYVGEMWDISNKITIGPSEVELVQTIIDGVAKLIELEKVMHTEKTYDDIFQELSINA
ncbi:unnamed protein product [Rotaria sp. Silwood1]|nr:unnamed protein product [Rotaria sp. Silwood1]CAF3408762.1 unnamed protein product [Rotaria sp. Silwood1]CAF3864701.1 unnamed protein product [Rotaria sp. Silwood1]CAF3924162.1 unnamed protein product [Rotaria sp. Silwood1]CAF3989812.1 unnamed protein product [Rotaria sp. Silwood1]